MRTAKNNKKPAFTLVELLVVISIIGVLLATLLPALSGAKLQALRVKQSNNMRQVITGFLQYSEDNRGTLPSRNIPWQTPWFGANRFFNASDVMDIRPAIRQYGIVSATANPILGTPDIDDAGNVSGAELCWNFCWFPGNGVLSADDSPTRVVRGTPSMAMIVDSLQVDPTFSVYYATTVTNAATFNFYPGNTTSKFAVITDPSLIPGIYAGRYDASVRWVPMRDIAWISYGNGWKNGYITP